METIPFDASVYKIGTLADGGIRLTLDLPEGALEALAKLAACQQTGVYLHVSAVPFVKESLTGLDDATEKTAEESSSSMGSRRTTKRRDQRAGSAV